LTADYCREKGYEVIGKIPYDPAVNKAMINGLSVVEYPCSGVAFEIKRIWECIERALR
jgi:MinD superfamily P-loop ATPase